MVASRLVTKTVLFTALVGSLAAVPASAGAATVAVEAKCFLKNGDAGNQPIPFTAAGLAAGQSGTATLSGDGVTGGSAAFSADAAGNAVATLGWTSSFEPLVPMRERAGTVTLTDAAGAVIATTPITLGNIGLKIGSGKLKAVSSKVNWEVSGLSPLTGSARYYAHFIKSKDAKKAHPKAYGSMKLGTAKGPCGYLKAKKPIAPFKRSGKFVVAIQSTSKFSDTGLSILGGVELKKVKK